MEIPDVPIIPLLPKTKDSQAPFARLVPELLALIFEHGYIANSTPFSQLVSSVCWYWRRVALDTPCLWSCLRFWEPESDDDDDASGSDAETHKTHTFDISLVYLERSKSYPIDIYASYYQDSFLISFLDSILIPHLHHCRTLSISGPSASLVSYVARIDGIRAPILEKLSIHSDALPEGTATFEDGGHRPRPVLLFDTPALHFLSLCMVPLDWTDPNSLFRPERITRFSFKWDPHRLPWADTLRNRLYPVIESMSNLRELTLHGMELDGVDSSTFPHLRLDRLSPTLQRMILRDIPTSWKPSSHTGFPHLTTFLLEYCFPGILCEVEFFNFLSCAPRLAKLILGRVRIDQSVSNSIEPIFLPDLTYLGLLSPERTTITSLLHNVVAPVLMEATFVDSFQSNEVLEDSTQPLPPTLPKFWLSCLRIEHITMSYGGCGLSKTSDLLAVLSTLQHLKSIALCGRPYGQWDDELIQGLSTTPWRAPALAEISFVYMTRITQQQLEAFVRARLTASKEGHCIAIRRLWMRGCSGLKSTPVLEEMVDDVQHWI